jgi:hypothetical protein
MREAISEQEALEFRAQYSGLLKREKRKGERKNDIHADDKRILSTLQER